MSTAHSRSSRGYGALQQRLPHLGRSQVETWAHRSNRHRRGMRPTPANPRPKGQTMTFPNTFSTERQIGTPVRPRPSRAKSAHGEIKSLSLALQGGGAFGAFTWGVLDRLLEEEIELDAISGA